MPFMKVARHFSWSNRVMGVLWILGNTVWYGQILANGLEWGAVALVVAEVVAMLLENCCLKVALWLRITFGYNGWLGEQAVLVIPGLLWFHLVQLERTAPHLFR